MNAEALAPLVFEHWHLTEALAPLVFEHWHLTEVYVDNVSVFAMSSAFSVSVYSEDNAAKRRRLGVGGPGIGFFQRRERKR